MNWVTTIHSHSQLPTITHNHLQPPTTSQTTVQNHPQTPTRIYNQLQPPTNTQKLPPKNKTCHMQLFYCTLDVNTETGADFDSDMIYNGIYTCVCVCVCVGWVGVHVCVCVCVCVGVYIFYKILYLLFFR